MNEWERVTISVVWSLHSLGETNGRSGFDAAVQKAERYLNERVNIGLTLSTQALIQEMVRKKYDEKAVMRALENEVHSLYYVP
jgi:hypothetical protein